MKGPDRAKARSLLRSGPFFFHFFFRSVESKKEKKPRGAVAPRVLLGGTRISAAFLTKLPLHAVLSASLADSYEFQS